MLGDVREVMMFMSVYVLIKTWITVMFISWPYNWGWASKDKLDEDLNKKAVQTPKNILISILQYAVE